MAIKLLNIAFVLLLFGLVGSKFYIYEWADEFGMLLFSILIVIKSHLLVTPYFNDNLDDVWPKPGAELVKSGYNHVS